jgi:hypothetical protein
VLVANTAAQDGQLALVGDVYGSPLDAALVSCDQDRDGCTCQAIVIRSYQKLADTKIKEFLRCKRRVLKRGATSAADLEACMNNPVNPDSIAADSKGRIGKKIAKLLADTGGQCDGVDTCAAFPGTCSCLTDEALGRCIEARTECRVCLMLTGIDDLDVDCDLFDDESVNGSCPPEGGEIEVAVDARADTCVVLRAGQTMNQENHGADQHVCVGLGTATALWRGLVRFDLPILPSGAEFRRAELQLDLDTPQGAANSTISACPAGAAWTELGVHWDDQPAASSPCAVTDVGTAPATYRWDVTEAVGTWYAGTAANDGLVMSATNESTINLRSFHSRESAGGPPRLAVVYVFHP